MKRLICIAFAALVVSPAHASPPAPLAEAIAGFADYKTFHATDAQIDAVLSPHCEKKRAVKDNDGLFYEYACKPASGLSSAQLTFMRYAGKPLFLMSLHVVFSNDYYPAMRKAVQDKLGKPKRGGADSATWEYTKDKKLNEHGNPVIMLARDRDGKSSSFDVALEQGP